MTKRKVTVQEAAEELGLTVDAVRQRLRRGKLPRATPPEDDDKRVYVWLDLNQTYNPTDDETETRHDVQGESRDELVGELRERVRFLETELEDWKEESRRKDAIIMTMAQRIPELEPAKEGQSEPRESPVTAPEESDNGRIGAEAQKPSEQRSWLYRFFFGP